MTMFDILFKNIQTVCLHNKKLLYNFGILMRNIIMLSNFYDMKIQHIKQYIKTSTLYLKKKAFKYIQI